MAECIAIKASEKLIHRCVVTYFLEEPHQDSDETFTVKEPTATPLKVFLHDYSKAFTSG